MHDAVYQALVRRARTGRLITYSELAAVGGFDLVEEKDREELARSLDEITDFELSQGRPLIAAIVVSKETNRPGGGFFVFARARGRVGPAEDEDTYWAREVGQVHAAWSGRPDRP